MNPFLDPVLRRARHTPDRLFGVFHDGEVWQPASIGDFMRRAQQFAAMLARHGARRGDTVLLVVRHGLDAHAAFVGAMLAGTVPGFLPHPNAKQDADLYWRQHRAVFRLCQPAAVVASDDLVEIIRAHAYGSGAAVLPLSAVESEAPLDGLIVQPGDAPALLQHSSGTTGLKKGVVLTYTAIVRQLAAYQGALALDQVADARIATWLPLYHDMGLISSFLLPLWSGVPIASLDPFSWIARPGLFFEAIESYHATHAWLPNFAFMHLARAYRDERQYDLRSLIAVINCSEPCKPAAFDAFLRRFGAWGIGAEALLTCYAMAETVFAVSQSSIGTAVRRLTVDSGCIEHMGAVAPPDAGGRAVTLLSNGRPLDGCDVAVLRDGAFMPERQTGELCVAAPFLFNGYHNNVEATEAAFFDGFYRTGDVGFIDGGEVFVVGRRKDLIIVNGKNIFAHDVEAAVSAVPGVKPGRAVAFGDYVDAVGSERLVVVAERAGDVAGGDLIRAINAAVMDEVGLACEDIRLVEQGWLVKTTSGKISRAENVMKYRGLVLADRRDRAAST